MEMIDISGYVAEEKLAIAQKYLIPQVLFEILAAVPLASRGSVFNGIRKMQKNSLKSYCHLSETLQ